MANNTRKRNTRKSKNASMKVRVPGAKKSVDSMKYEIANEVNTNKRSAKRNSTAKKNKTN